ncbi:MAG: serine/threonine-protein phosphatase [Ktedonobacteraceae bacterium]|nr:serine/threonine-protein phosphatase [Ktedonobacteraceae bacterium]
MTIKLQPGIPPDGNRHVWVPPVAASRATPAEVAVNAPASSVWAPPLGNGGLSARGALGAGAREPARVTRPIASRRWQRQLAVYLDAGSGWDTGCVRKESPNEDSLITVQGTCLYNERLQTFGLFIVADGMGGHAYGQDASYLAIQTILQSVLGSIAGSDSMSDELLPEVLCDAVREANLVIYRRGREAGNDMGTTITAALVLDTTAYIVNVGDSRTYLYREGEGLAQITRDHSVVARLVETGVIAPEEVYDHPNRNQVYRGLGSSARVEVDWFKCDLQVDDRLLLCSDGLWEMVRDREIARILKQTDSKPAQMSQQLIQAALRGGGLDNISVIVVHVAPVVG